MVELKFELRPVEEKPRSVGSSKYDAILDAFLDGDDGLVQVEVEDRNPNHVRTALKNRIDARSLDDRVKASVINKTLYLEKLT